MSRYVPRPARSQWRTLVQLSLIRKIAHGLTRSRSENVVILSVCITRTPLNLDGLTWVRLYNSEFARPVADFIGQIAGNFIGILSETSSQDSRRSAWYFQQKSELFLLCHPNFRTHSSHHVTSPDLGGFQKTIHCGLWKSHFDGNPVILLGFILLIFLITALPILPVRFLVLLIGLLVLLIFLVSFPSRGQLLVQLLLELLWQLLAHLAVWLGSVSSTFGAVFYLFWRQNIENWDGVPSPLEAVPWTCAHVLRLYCDVMLIYKSLSKGLCLFSRSLNLKFTSFGVWLLVERLWFLI